MFKSASLCFAVALCVLSLCPCVFAALKQPQYAATADQVFRANRALSAHIRSITADPDFVPGTAPSFRLHQPGVPVRGTVVFFHGYSDVPSRFDFFAAYLFRNGYNVFQAALPGHTSDRMQSMPAARLRTAYGFDVARRILRADPVIGPALRDIDAGGPSPLDITPSLEAIISYADIAKRGRTVLKQNMSPRMYARFMKAMNAISRTDYYPGLERELRLYFDSDHDRYQFEPAQQLSLVSALPGPLSVVGFSAGGMAAVYAAGRTKTVDKLILLAPYLAQGIVSDINLRFLYAGAGALNLFNSSKVMLTSSASLAPVLAQRISRQDEITRNVRTHAKTLCLIAEDDIYVNAKEVLRRCNGVLRNKHTRTFLYPKEDGLGHFVLPVEQMRFVESLSQELLRFLATGNIKTARLRKEAGSVDLPSVTAS